MTSLRLLTGVDPDVHDTFQSHDMPQLQELDFAFIDSAEMLVAYNARLQTAELHALINHRATIEECFTLRTPQYYLTLRSHVVPESRRGNPQRWAPITPQHINHNLVDLDSTLKHTTKHLHYVHYRAAPYGTDDRTIVKIQDHLTTLLTGTYPKDHTERPFFRLTKEQQHKVRNTTDMILFDIHQPNVITEHEVLNILDDYAEIFDASGQYLRKMPDLILNETKDLVDHWVSIPMGTTVAVEDIVLPARVMHYGTTQP